ncbi:DUF808 domain-containing protein [Cognatishimia sp. MH4019]|uniref:DUF808 domain-containing protein n=1 Tax=Cognatishimia sp. MH4019 TaxID=2854030 RepID=UPI001CD4D97F|nr:DUF808 domain-containing protein [Cognatishimia sp. MH4019]
MSGLLALLDDVAGIAKVAAASVDDVAAQALKSGSKAAGAVIDDAAVTPKYVQGFDPARELPIIWKIARASLFNKLVFLLPAGMALNTFAPWAIPILLILGGAYLCFEGAEKVHHWLFPHDELDHGVEDVGDPAHLEEEKVKGAIKTDFILSAEIMTIALAAIPASTFWFEAATLATVAIGITLAVYGSVALIVKADDLGLLMSAEGRLGLTRKIGRGIVKGMPKVLKLLMIIGTAAMLWVGGNIIVHSLAVLGLDGIETVIKGAAKAVAAGVDGAKGFVNWLVVATLDGLLGLAIGFGLIPLVTNLIVPLWARIASRA